MKNYVLLLVTAKLTLLRAALAVFALMSTGPNVCVAHVQEVRQITSRTDAVALVRDQSAINTSEMAILQQSKPLVTRTGAWHTWNDRIHLDSGQEKLKLVLVITNGADGRPKFSDLKVQLARQPYLTLKDFDGADLLSCDLTRKLSTGNTPITVQGFGPSGARLNWKVYIRKPEITAVTPNPSGPSERLRVEGNYFSADSGAARVLVANKPAKILSKQDSLLEVKLPPHISGGSQDLIVKSHSVQSEVFKIRVKSSPQITWINLLAAPPGQPVNLTGRGFSATPSENIVQFGREKARILSASETSITCIIPEMHFPQWHVPIVVITNGMPSKERISINIDQRVIDNQGVPMR